MSPTFWMFLPPVGIVIGLIVLVHVLRVLLHRAGHVYRGPDFSGSYTYQPNREEGVPLTWRASLVDLWLPLLLGAVIIVGSVWALTWIGWLAAALSHGSAALGAAPPWFGSPWLIPRFVLIGVLTTSCVVVACGAALLAAALVGIRALWPESGIGVNRDLQAPHDGRRP